MDGSSRRAVRNFKMPYLTSGSATRSDSGERSSNAFEELVQGLSIALGPTSGLDSDDVDPLQIQRLMELYTSNQNDWHRFALGDSTRSYTRNLIDEGNGKSNLVSFPVPLTGPSPALSLFGPAYTCRFVITVIVNMPDGFFVHT